MTRTRKGAVADKDQALVSRKTVVFLLFKLRWQQELHQIRVHDLDVFVNARIDTRIASGMLIVPNRGNVLLSYTNVCCRQRSVCFREGLANNYQTTCCNGRVGFSFRTELSSELSLVSH